MYALVFQTVLLRQFAAVVAEGGSAHGAAMLRWIDDGGLTPIAQRTRRWPSSPCTTPEEWVAFLAGTYREADEGTREGEYSPATAKLIVEGSEASSLRYRTCRGTSIRYFPDVRGGEGRMEIEGEMSSILRRGLAAATVDGEQNPVDLQDIREVLLTIAEINCGRVVLKKEGKEGWSRDLSRSSFRYHGPGISYWPPREGEKEGDKWIPQEGVEIVSAVEAALAAEEERWGDQFVTPVGPPKAAPTTEEEEEGGGTAEKILEEEIGIGRLKEDPDEETA